MRLSGLSIVLVAGVVCGLLLALVPSATHASTVTPPQQSADSMAALSAAAAIDLSTAPGCAERLASRPPYHPGNRPPYDSILPLLDPEDDDECSRKRLSSGSSHRAVEERVGLQRASRALGESPTRDRCTGAGQFLIETVRRM